MDTTAMDGYMNRAIRFMMQEEKDSVLSTLIEGVERGERYLAECVGGPVERSVRERMFNLYELLVEARVKTGDQVAAIGLLRRAVPNVEALGDSTKIVMVYRSMSRCLHHIDDDSSALKWVNKAREYDRGINRADAVALELALANAYFALGSEDTALSRLYRALGMNEEGENLINDIDLCSGLMRHHLSVGRLDSVEHYLGRCKALISSQPNLASFTDHSDVEGEVLLRQGYPQEALPLLLVADSMASRLRSFERVARIKQLLSVCYSALGLTAEALRAGDESRRAMRSGLASDRVRRVAVEQAELLHERERELAEAELLGRERSRQLAWAVVGGAVVIAGLLGWALFQKVRAGRRLRKANEDLRSAQSGLVKAERERAAADVRTNIARDVHDDLGAELAKVALLSDEARSTSGDTAAQEEALAALADHARKVGTAVREIIWSTDPGSDNVGAMIDHVEHALRAMTKGEKVELRTRFEARDRMRPLRPEERRHVLLVMKEAVHNALKHGSPDVVDVELRVEGDRFTLRIMDDGRAAGGTSGTGHGLKNMRDRLDLLGGSLIIGPGEGGGTLVSAQGRFALQ